MIPYLQTLFRYDDWANRESLKSLECVESPPQRAMEIMGHIVGCQWLWFGRLKLEKEPAVVWPELTLAECSEQLDQLAEAWQQYLDGVKPTSLEQDVSYINSKGEPWTSNVRDILFHTAHHSGYHRGQIATLLGQVGEKAAYTDFIHCVREGYVS